MGMIGTPNCSASDTRDTQPDRCLIDLGMFEGGCALVPPPCLVEAAALVAEEELPWLDISLGHAAAQMVVDDPAYRPRGRWSRSPPNAVSRYMMKLDVTSPPSPGLHRWKWWNDRSRPRSAAINATTPPTRPVT